MSQRGLLTSLDPGGGGGGGKQAIFPLLLLNLVWTEQSSRNSPFPALGSSIPGAQGPELAPAFCPAGQPTPVHPRAPEESQILRSQHSGRPRGAETASGPSGSARTIDLLRSSLRVNDALLTESLPGAAKGIHRGSLRMARLELNNCDGRSTSQHGFHAFRHENQNH